MSSVRPRIPPVRGDCSRVALDSRPSSVQPFPHDDSRLQETMTAGGVELRAVETFADLLFAFDSDEPASGFYSRLAEATCRLADMDRVVIFLYDDGLRRVRAVGSHGIDLGLFTDMHITLDDVPMALRA